MTALNPTLSRFTLSIPLLGRAKVPLDSVLGLKKRNGGLFQSVIDFGYYANFFAFLDLPPSNGGQE
jgi:hypothetical protein